MKFLWSIFAVSALVAGPLAAQDEQDPKPVSLAEIVDASSQEVGTDRVGASETIAAPPPLLPTEDFASRSVFNRSKLSPNGSKFLHVRMDDRKPTIEIIDTATFSVIDAMPLQVWDNVDWVRWVDDTNLAASISTLAYRYGSEVELSRLYLRNIQSKAVFEFPSKDKLWDIREAIYFAPDGAYALIAVQEKPDLYPSVFRYELKPGGAMDRVVEPKKGIVNWHADEAGAVRLGLGWFKKRLHVYYRRNAAGNFKLIGKLDGTESNSRFWSIVQIISGSDEGYALEKGASGRVGIRKFNYSTGEVVETFYEHPDWDVESMWVDDDGQPIAAFYTDTRERVVWFDEENERLYSHLKKEMPFADVSVISQSRDKAQSLVWNGDEANPGAMFVYDKTDGTLREFGKYRPSLAGAELAYPQAISYNARDGLEIAGYLTLPIGREPVGLPLIILPHGGPYGVRDTLTYNDEVQFLTNRGYAVLQPNFRGSGGYGQDFYDAGAGQIGRKMQDDLDDAMDWAVAKGLADPDRVCVVGASYGGYAAIWSVLRNPERYRCAASWAGVTDFPAMLKYDRLFFTRKAAKRWQNQVKGDRRFDLKSISPTNHASDLSRPLLIAHGAADRIVPFEQYQAFEEQANDAPIKLTKFILGKEGHGFSSASNEQRWYDALDRFLAQHNPADQVDAKGNFAPPE